MAGKTTTRDTAIAATIAADLLASADRFYADGDIEAMRARNVALWNDARAHGAAVDREVLRLVRNG